MAANPNLIGGGRMTRAEVSGDTRRLEGAKLPRGVLLKRLWKYLGRNRFLLVLALALFLMERSYRKEKDQGDEELEKIKEEIRKLKGEQE